MPRKILEEAHFHLSNGGLTLAIAQDACTSEKDGRIYGYQFQLCAELSKHGTDMRIEIPLGSARVLRWLIGALERVIPHMDFKEPVGLWDDHGYGRAHIDPARIRDGETVVRPTPAVDQSTSSPVSASIS